MKHHEIKERIEEIFYNQLNDRQQAISELTDLFIELSNERCEDQKKLCHKWDLEGYKILTAPLPLILYKSI